MTLRWTTPILAALAVGVLSPARAAAQGQATEKPAAHATVALLGLEAIDVPENIGQEITEALRQRIAATEGLRLVPGKDLVEVKLVFGCSDEAPACLAQAGNTLGATKVVLGNVRRIGGDFMLTLKMVDVARGTLDAVTSDAIPGKRAEPATFQQRSSRWVSKLTGRETTGSVQLRASVAGAALTLDGVAVGLTDAQPVTIPDIAPGKHEIAAEKQGYAPSRQTFTLSVGQSLPLSLVLTPVAPGMPAAVTPVVVRRDPTDRQPSPEAAPNLARVGFWTALVGAATSAALAVKFGHDVKQNNKDLDPFRRYECGNVSSTGLCNKNGEAANPLTLAEKGVVASKTDEGNRAQTLQWVFVGLIPPLAIAGGYLLYRGYLDGEGSGGSASNHGLRIFPTASASAGGVMAEFDF
jgi:TolB-like protein